MMTECIVLLRGINVGGKRKILMKDLRVLLEGLGFSKVQTYIQSGNILLQSEERNILEIESLISQGIFNQYGFEVPVIARSLDEWQQLNQNNPYKGVVDSQLHVIFFQKEPTKERLNELKTISAGDDEMILTQKEAYLRCYGKYHETKLGNNVFEKKLQVTCTTRTWKTVVKLNDLLEK